jgi:hypothetical protein
MRAQNRIRTCTVRVLSAVPPTRLGYLGVEKRDSRPRRPEEHRDPLLGWSCALGAIRTHTGRSLRPLPLPLGYGGLLKLSGKGSNLAFRVQSAAAYRLADLRKGRGIAWSGRWLTVGVRCGSIRRVLLLRRVLCHGYGDL